MFSYEEIRSYSDADLAIYRYIVEHAEAVAFMSVRELAAATHTSPASVMRFCERNGCAGYAELKARLSEERAAATVEPSADLQELRAFFERVASPAFEDKLAPAVRTLQKASVVLFLGIGSSGALARYGARLFSNFGKPAVGLEDAAYPADALMAGAAAVVLSESGETPAAIAATEAFQHEGVPVLGIVNDPASTLARMADWSFSYRFESHRVNGGYNVTTQVPVLLVIETLARRL